MNSAVTALPAGYEALEGFVADWAISDLVGRAQRRDKSTPEARQAFYQAIKDVAPAALAELDKKPLEALDAAEQRLLALLLSYAHVALAVEVLKDGEAAHAVDRRRMVITHVPPGLPSRGGAYGACGGQA